MGHRLALLVSGASGMLLPCHGLRILLRQPAIETIHLVVSRGAGQIIALKEGWPLVLGFRETPLSIVHLENLRRLAFAGATILPPIPAFYIGGEDLGRFVEAYILRILDCLGIGSVAPSGLRWSGGSERASGASTRETG